MNQEQEIDPSNVNADQGLTGFRFATSSKLVSEASANRSNALLTGPSTCVLNASSLTSLQEVKHLEQKCLLTGPVLQLYMNMKCSRYIEVRSNIGYVLRTPYEVSGTRD